MIFALSITQDGKSLKSKMIILSNDSLQIWNDFDRFLTVMYYKPVIYIINLISTSRLIMAYGLGRIALLQTSLQSFNSSLTHKRIKQ